MDLMQRCALECAVSQRTTLDSCLRRNDGGERVTTSTGCTLSDLSSLRKQGASDVRGVRDEACQHLGGGVAKDTGFLLSQQRQADACQYRRPIQFFSACRPCEGRDPVTLDVQRIRTSIPSCARRGRMVLADAPTACGLRPVFFVDMAMPWPHENTSCTPAGFVINLTHCRTTLLRLRGNKAAPCCSATCSSGWGIA